MLLYDAQIDEFTRGAHEHETLLEVAESDPEYLVYLMEEGKTDQDTLNAIEEFMEESPEYFEDIV
jgi:hypothetical protein